MICWMLFLVVSYGFYSYVQRAPLSGLLDKETGGLISLTFFIGWSLVWFCIGRHYSYDYTAKKDAFYTRYPSLNDKVVAKAFLYEYTSKIAKMLSRVFFISVLAYVAANVHGDVSLRNCIYIGVLMALSILMYWYYKTHNNFSVVWTHIPLSLWGCANLTHPHIASPLASFVLLLHSTAKIHFLWVMGGR